MGCLPIQRVATEYLPVPVLNFVQERVQNTKLPNDVFNDQAHLHPVVKWLSFTNLKSQMLLLPPFKRAYILSLTELLLHFHLTDSQ